MSKTWDDVQRTIQSCRGRKANWDSYGAVAPDDETIDAAISLAIMLRAYGMKPPDECGAASNGRISFAWESLSIEIGANGTAEIETWII